MGVALSRPQHARMREGVVVDSIGPVLRLKADRAESPVLRVVFPAHTPLWVGWPHVAAAVDLQAWGVRVHVHAEAIGSKGCGVAED